ncbi:hypothetical protein [Desulfosudis oleivorans]|uniref:Peptidase C39 domain-containing protein n=1 Tax=Desulfosudis oleivorans (strain DSM 6200 / JCM 39069 / Hxd3) TaxID=96561 RepID=A8ZXD0_DESOH|nr:hypothetical protein [Desulfosudis oleivorans]ABW68509.1 hypothetical protein Dole_2706 [Desulfosudis oleivorans Hxd3]
MKPYRQGDLDGLCGIYSIVNSVRYIKKLNTEESEELFYKCLRLAEKKRKLSTIVKEGSSLPVLINIFNEIVDIQYGIKSTRPFHKRKDVSLGCYWDYVVTFLEVPGRAVLAGIDCENAEGHWSVVVKATPKTFYLMDSYYEKLWHRRKMSTKRISINRPYLVAPTHSFFLG